MLSRMMFAAGLCATAQAVEKESALVAFQRPDGAYTSAMLEQDCGNGAFYSGRDHARIRDGALEITFVEGKKVDGTGAGAAPKIPRKAQYTLQYRIRYDGRFEAGLHGKQFGFNFGAGYNGGRGDEAREKGDGGSVRIQFDAMGDQIQNQLYVYSSDMTTEYGANPGGQKFLMPRGEWATIRLTVTMNSAIDSKDGRIEVWRDGTKAIDVGQLRLARVETGRALNAVSMESFPGGAGIFPTFDNRLSVDDFQWRPGRMDSVPVALSPAASSRHPRRGRTGSLELLRAAGVDLQARRSPRTRPQPLLPDP